MAGKIVHFEIMGPDGDELSSFYSDIFGWQGEAVPGFNAYNMVAEEQVGVGGAIGSGNEDMPSYVTMYIEVDDIEAIHRAGLVAPLDAVLDAQGDRSAGGEVEAMRNELGGHGEVPHPSV